MTQTDSVCVFFFLGPRKLPCVDAQRHSAAPEPRHEPHHPQTGLRGKAAGPSSTLKRFLKEKIGKDIRSKRFVPSSDAGSESTRSLQRARRGRQAGIEPYVKLPG